MPEFGRRAQEAWSIDDDHVGTESVLDSYHDLTRVETSQFIVLEAFILAFDILLFEVVTLIECLRWFPNLINAVGCLCLNTQSIAFDTSCQLTWISLSERASSFPLSKVKKQ